MPNGNFFSTDAAPILPEGHGALILDPLRAESVALNPAVSQTIMSGTRAWTIPVVATDAAASWVREGEEIAPSNPTMRDLTIVPAKTAGLVPVSRETMDDSSPSAREVVGASLAASIREQVDSAFLGAVAAPAPQGLGTITPTVITAPLDSLDPFLDAKAASAAVGGSPTGILIHPDDALVLYKLRDQADSNRPLVGETNSAAGLPLIVTSHATAGQIWLVDARKNYVVVREDIDVEVSKDAYFSSDRTAVRAVMRVGFGFVNEAANVRIDVDAA